MKIFGWCSVGRLKAAFTFLACCVSLSAVAGQGCVNFDDAKPGSVPKGWLATETGIGMARWTVEQDASAPSPSQVLKQSGEAEFPVCIFQQAGMADGFVEVRFKPVSGREDEAAGVIFRVKDKNDYYAVRANALEDNVVLFHTLHGHREEVKGVDAKVTAQQWHKLRVEFRGRHFAVFYDGKRMLEADDDSLSGPGKIGVWTKSDSVTEFDDFCFGELR